MPVGASSMPVGASSMPVVELSTGERPFIDILQDHRYWVIHVITVPSSLWLCFSSFVK